MQFTRNQIIFLVVGGIIALLLLLILFGVLPGRKESVNVTQLTAWGVEDARTMRVLTDQFQAAHPTVSVTYRQFSEATYEEDMLNALAAGEKPDILMFENNWLLKHGDKLVGAPAEKITAAGVQTLFPTVVSQDFVTNNTVYALPLYIDTLATVYSRDLFDKGGVVFPPETWEEVGESIDSLRVMEGSNIKRAAYAIGGSSRSMENAGDMVQAMLLQNGAEMISSRLNSALFGNAVGKDAFGIYMRFSDPDSAFYTWNDSMAEAKEALAKGDVAAIFAYSSELRDFKARNAFLNVGIAPLPQFDPINRVDIADYWGLAVFSGSTHPLEAWDFVVFTTTNTNTSGSYLALTGNSPALRSLIEEASSNPELNVFANQALTARSWLQPGEDEVNNAFDTAIRLVLSNELTPAKAIQQASALVTEALRSI